MLTLLLILIILVCVLLVLVVLIQNPKGGGLTAGMGGANQVIGARKATDIVEKATWTLGLGLMVLCLLAAVTNPTGTTEESRSAVQEQFQNDPNAITPNLPAQPLPGQQPPPQEPSE